MSKVNNSKDLANKSATFRPEPASSAVSAASGEAEVAGEAPGSAVVAAASSPPEATVDDEAPSGVHDVPILALRCDGRILVSIVDLKDLDLSSREIWVGMALTEAESADVHDRIPFEEAASPVVARIREQLKKKTAK